MPPLRTIAIVGGGFCGTVVAANLLAISSGCTFTAGRLLRFEPREERIEVT